MVKTTKNLSGYNSTINQLLHRRIYMKKISLYLIAFFTYFILDVGYNLIIGLRLDNYYYKKAGIENIIATEPQYLSTIPLFFIIIVAANIRLVINQALEKRSIPLALVNGFLLGVACYATFALPLLWLIKDYPFNLAVIHIVLGGLLSLATSGFTTWLALRKSSAEPKVEAEGN